MYGLMSTPKKALNVYSREDAYIDVQVSVLLKSTTKILSHLLIYEEFPTLAFIIMPIQKTKEYAPKSLYELQ